MVGEEERSKKKSKKNWNKHMLDTNTNIRISAAFNRAANIVAGYSEGGTHEKVVRDVAKLAKLIYEAEEKFAQEVETKASRKRELADKSFEVRDMVE